MVRITCRLLLLCFAVTSLAFCQSRDETGLGILKALSAKPSTLSADATIRQRVGEADESTAVHITLSNSFYSLDETLPNGTHRVDTVFRHMRLNKDRSRLNSPFSAVNYVIAPQFEIFDDIADPNLAVEAATTQGDMLTVRVHGTTSLPLGTQKTDKQYVVSMSTRRIVALRSTEVIGAYTFLHEFRFADYQMTSAGLPLPATIHEYVNGNAVRVITISSWQSN